MAYLKTCALVLLVVRVWSPSQATSTLRRHTKVEVSRALAITSRTYRTISIPPGASQNLRCSTGCAAFEWCHLWCHDVVSSECIFTNIFVMPDYEETNKDDALVCYTLRRKSHVGRATIESTPEKTDEQPLRVKENLLDEYYVTKDKDQCALLITTAFPWFLLDFGEPVTFQHVVIVAQPGTNANLFENVEVRTGTSPVSTLGDFSSYAMFAKFAGPATANQVIEFEVTAPVMARFVSIQVMNGDTLLQVCHIEVF
ncbi:uncharacterized protein LOC122243945 [Penaeus japonicus]|uniref:uncharacterized protein LOC122243945 n=1 Tax=Penaeus japonicus TaxID=27405 RepID=UPI001C70BABD|nr:uncharacterized protein LOC122243945 [Penaeus japonicus]